MVEEKRRQSEPPWLLVALDKYLKHYRSTSFGVP